MRGINYWNALLLLFVILLNFKQNKWTDSSLLKNAKTYTTVWVSVLAPCHVLNPNLLIFSLRTNCLLINIYCRVHSVAMNIKTSHTMKTSLCVMLSAYRRKPLIFRFETWQYLLSSVIHQTMRKSSNIFRSQMLLNNKDLFFLPTADSHELFITSYWSCCSEDVPFSCFCLYSSIKTFLFLNYILNFLPLKHVF